MIAHASRQGRGAAAVEALFSAYFEEALDIGSEPVLAAIAARLGIEEGEVRAALRDDALRASVVDIEEEAGRLGIGGVPFFIIKEKWSVSGAQPTEVWLDILQWVHGSPAEVQNT
ncbi:MAG: DsbA family protein [Pseudomonadota bacterium]|nr:DsbA family protein [Pseudomonadota bacterium]